MYFRSRWLRAPKADHIPRSFIPRDFGFRAAMGVKCCSYKVARRGVLLTNMILLIFAIIFLGVGGVSIGVGVFDFQFVVLIGFAENI